MLKSILFLSIFLTVVGCGNSGINPKKPTANPVDVIIEKEKFYLNLIRQKQDEYGFIEHSHCDSLLFSGLAVVFGLQVKLQAAYDPETDRWFRTPHKDCYRNDRTGQNHPRRSASTISRDMFAGLFWAIHHTGSVVIAKRLIQYGENHNWIMGDGPVDRTYLTINFQNTLRMLAGEDPDTSNDLWVDPLKDHQRHIVALNIALRGEIKGHISDQMLTLIRDFSRYHSRNALYQYILHRYTDGDQSVAISILADNVLFPLERLPNSNDRCARWLWERAEEEGKWKACQEGKTHTGGDFLFISRLLKPDRD